jgi:hypothetical protein
MPASANDQDKGPGGGGQHNYQSDCPQQVVGGLFFTMFSLHVKHNYKYSLFHSGTKVMAIRPDGIPGHYGMIRNLYTAFLQNSALSLFARIIARQERKVSQVVWLVNRYIDQAGRISWMMGGYRGVSACNKQHEKY